MGDKAKLNPFQSLDDGTDESEPYGGYKPPDAEEPKKKKKGPARASKALPASPNPFSPPPTTATPAEPVNPFTPPPNPFVQNTNNNSQEIQQPPPPNPFHQHQQQQQPPTAPPSSQPPFAPAPNPFVQKQTAQPSPPPQQYQPQPNPFLQSSSNVNANTRVYSPPAPYSSSGGPNSSAKEAQLDQREMELNRREQALAARERELATREAKLGKTIARTPNWPRWPKPFLYHDIEQDIPADKRRVVRQAYIFWFAKMFFVLYNLVVVVALLIVDGRVSDFILGIFYLVIWSIVLFLNYRLLYQACWRMKALSFGFFLFWFGIETLVFILWTIGVRGSGMTGILWMIWCFKEDEKVVGFMCLVGVIFTSFCVIFCIYLWIRARSFYSECGGNKKAQNQLERDAAHGAANAAANNPDVVVDVARTSSGY